MERRKLDILIINFIINILNWALLLLVFTITLSQLGVDTTAMIALLGGGGYRDWSGAAGSMKNFASGSCSSSSVPFHRHFVEAASTSGTVESITLFTSTLLTADNREVIIPNSAIYNDTITNYSALPTAASIWSLAYLIATICAKPENCSKRL